MPDKTESWIEDSDILSFFPTCVWSIQSTPAFHQPLNARIREALDQMNPELADIPPARSWQSGQDLQEHEELAELFACILVTAKKFLKFLHIAYDAVEITGSWANVNAPGAAHAMHNHPNNYLSGVYYVQTQPGADTINFHDPRLQTGIIRPPVTELSTHNTDQVVVEVSTGKLLLFPAWLTHSVAPNESAEMRISISFNIMFSRFTEEVSKPLWGDE